MRSIQSSISQQTRRICTAAAMACPVVHIRRDTVAIRHNRNPSMASELWMGAIDINIVASVVLI